MTTPAVGAPMARVDAVPKVTGAQRYPTERSFADLVHAVVVQSTVARGRITNITTDRALAAPGVLAVLTHHTMPSLHGLFAPDPGEPPPPPPPGLLQSPTVLYSGQHIAVVVAQTLEEAEHAAALVHVSYRAAPARTDFEAGLAQAYEPPQGFAGPPTYARGDADGALGSAPVTVDGVYTTPTEHHNPLGPTGTLAYWEGERLNVIDATQGVFQTRSALATSLGVSIDLVRVVAPFVGGAFGAMLLPWPHTVLAAVAARQVGRPVKLVLTRQQMYTSHGHRPQTHQRVRLGARRDGTLLSVIHEGITDTSQYANRDERLTTATDMLYQVQNLRSTRRLVRLDTITPTPMRAPGECTGLFALETAVDELAHSLQMDPVELRRRNDAPADPVDGRPWSSKSLLAAYAAGAERIGWRQRRPAPRRRPRRGSVLGVGMASAVYPHGPDPASATARLDADGSAVVTSGATDIGPGTTTVMTQIAADALGLDPSHVRFRLGDTRLPPAPSQGGSTLVVSVGPAVHHAGLAVRRQLATLTRNHPRSPLYGLREDAISAASGRVFETGNPSRGESFRAVLSRHGGLSLEARHDTAPSDSDFSTHAFGAQFAEVRVDAELGEIRLSRFVGAYGVGTVLNPRTARSQMIGGITGGIGQALMQQSRMDDGFGRYTNANLWGNLIPVNADVPDVDVVFLEEVDPHVNVLGVKGLAEVCLVGVAAAIGNAVFNATGVRMRDLPFTPDAYLAAAQDSS